MKFDIITIFPEPFEAYFNESILRRAREKKLVDIKVWDLRDFAKEPKSKNGRRQIDDRPFGGGPGMVMSAEPLVKAISGLKIKNKKNTLFVILAAGGKQFNSVLAARYVKQYKHIVFICGRYEGVDERIIRIIRDSGFMIQEISVGPYVLTGGELPAMLIIDAVARHIPGVLGKNESLEEKRHGVGVPVYTRPEVFKYKGKKYPVPKVLLSGNHQKIAEWRAKNAV